MGNFRELFESRAEVAESMMRESLKVLEGELSAARWDRDRLEEALSNLDLYLDQRGWHSLNQLGGYDVEGPSLSQLQSASKLIREMSVMSVWVKRGLDLRQGYVWDGGIHYNLGDEVGSGRGRVSNRVAAARRVRELIREPLNWRNFFGAAARERREACLYADGQAFYRGHDESRVLSEVPLAHISGHYVNPEDSSEVWAYRRSWTDFSDGSANGVPRAEWIFVNTFFDRPGGKPRPKSIMFNGEREPVSSSHRMFVVSANGQTGWPYGVPDALGAMAWVEQYRSFLISGKKMSDAMAKIWAQAQSNTAQGAQVLAAKVAGDDNFMSMGQGQNISPLSTAGQSYDFAKGLPLIAAFAAGINVSVVALTADPGSAGASYGAARALDLPEQLTTSARRALHIDFDREVLIWLGAESDVDVWFETLQDSSEIYREVEANVYRWNTGLYSAEEIKLSMEDIFGRSKVGPVPDGVLIPNNRDSVERRDIDPNSSGTGGGGMIPTQGSGAQGVSSGGQDSNANDIRAD